MSPADADAVVRVWAERAQAWAERAAKAETLRNDTLAFLRDLLCDDQQLPSMLARARALLARLEAK